MGTGKQVVGVGWWGGGGVWGWMVVCGTVVLCGTVSTVVLFC